MLATLSESAHTVRWLVLSGCCALALCAATGVSAHPVAQPANPSAAGYSAEPSLAEIEQAFSEAAWEFDVPEPLLQVIAHSESRWRHRPHRVSTDGRVGVLQLTHTRRALAAQLLDLPQSQVQGDIHCHARSFAALLDSQRPEFGAAEFGAWREALAWTLELSPTAADAIVDHWFAMLAEGIIDRLADGSPIAIAPVAIDPAYLDLFAANAANGCRSIDYPGAAEVLTPCNYSPASRTVGDVDAVIIHTIEGSANGAISWFHNCSAQVSAHYVVSESGSVTQVVAEEDIGWHVSCWNGFSIGIEHEGYASDPTHPDTMYQASASLVTDILNDWNLPADRDHVVGHVEIDSNCNPNGHWDPGPGWDWNYYMSLLGSTNTVDLTELVGYVRHTDIYEASYGIAGAQVSISGHGSVSADSSGYYVFDEIPPGTWNICATATGYEENCRSKTVEADITNWGSILLEPAVAGDDDDTTGDDDTAGDDDSETAGDDDSETAGDDDSETAGDDDSETDGFDDDDGRTRTRSGCYCSTGNSGRIAQVPWALAFLPLLALLRRRRGARA